MHRKLLNLSMFLFAGVSLVCAAPMTRQEYNDYRGWSLPDGESGDDAGYIIEDRDGEKNTDELEGFVQWLPEKEFHRKFKVAESPQDRVALEQMEVDEKLENLNKFLNKGQPPFINDQQWQLLNEQQKHMNGYSEVLAKRIALF